jgi:hypothetical protein
MIKYLLPFLIFFTFSFQNIFAADYYWVGGNGNWTDYNHHWALSSGGTTFHTQVPGPLDNIYFDNNSLSGRTTINLDQTIESCKDISVTISTDTLLFNSNALNPQLSIYGSISLSPRLIISNSIKLYFEASSGTQSIAQKGAKMPCYLIFDNTGSWRVIDSMNVYSIEILNGSFDASNTKIRAAFFTKKISNAIANISGTIFYVSQFTFQKTNDITTGIKLYMLQSSVGVNIQGSTLTIDSIFCINKVTNIINSSMGIVGGAHINYLQLKNYSTFSTSFLGRIDRIDATNISSMDASYNISIGTFNVSNLKILSVEADIFNVDQLNLSGSTYDCNNLIQIIGDNRTQSQSKLDIHNNTAPIFNYCTIQNIDASDFPLKFTNSIDLGNNTGVTFLSYAGASTLYRIGDGEWSDATKWSYTSNGSPANCVPTIYTNVIFDVASFTKNTNVMTLNNASCKNLNIADIYGTLKIQGNLTCSGNFITDLGIDYSNSNLAFTSSTTDNKIELINSTDTNSQLSIYFTGTGTYNLLSDITCANFYNRGSQLFTNRHAINAYNLSLESGYFNGSTSTITVNYYTNLTNGEFNHLDSTTFNILHSFSLQSFGATTMQHGRIIIDSVCSIESNININIKHLEIKKSGLISSPMMYCDTLSISKGIIINSNIGSWEFDYFYNPGIPQCGKYTVIKPSNDLPVSLKSQRDVTFDYFLLEHIHAVQNGVNYLATNSIEGIDNTGITFTQPQTQSFYWIGGDGNWSDPAHWSLSSGGGTANCIPSRIDNVFFDIASFTGSSTVTVDDQFECNNFTLQNTLGSISFLKNNLNVYGSFDSDSTAYLYSISLLGNQNAIINCKKSSFYSITVRKSAKTTFISSLNTYVLDMQSGTNSFISASCFGTALNGLFKNADSLIIHNSIMSFSYQIYLDIRNGLVDCDNNLFDLTCDNDSPIYMMLSDSIPINIGNIRVANQVSEMWNNTTNQVTANFSNINIDTLSIPNILDEAFSMYLFNTKINTLDASNTNLTIYKTAWNDLTGIDRTSAQPENINVIKNAQLDSYTISISDIAFDNIKIYPGTRLYIQSNDTLYVNKSMDITGSPSYPIQIASSDNGIQGYIQNNGSVCGEYIFIQDNYVLNNPGYPGFLSSDITNNSGWNFNASCDTILCSFNKIPCENDSVQLNIVTNQILVNPQWQGPNGYSSSSVSPILKNLTNIDKGLYTFTCIQGKCALYIDVFSNTANSIINDLQNTGSLYLENYSETTTWLFNNSVIPNETMPTIYPITNQTGYYKAISISTRGCQYTTDSIYYMYPKDPLFKPILTSIGLDASGNIEVMWNSIANATGYYISGTTPFNPDDFYPQSFEEADATSSVINISAPGDYCLYVQAEIPGAVDSSLPSDTLCITIPDTDNNTTTVKPQLTYIGLTSSNDIEIRWNDVNGESSYTINNTTPLSQQNVFSNVGGANADATSFIIPNSGIGEYCLYIQANLTNTSDISIPSDTLCINVSNPISTGIRKSNTSSDNAIIYPNPNNIGTLNISPSTHAVYDVSIETLQGEKIFTKEDQMGIIQLTTSDLKQGVYLVKLHSDSFSICEKLIITK